MGPGKIIFALFATGLAIVCGLSMIDNLNDDRIYEIRELLGIIILCFVLFSCVSTMIVFSMSDFVCGIMEGRGDQLLYSGDPLGARRWYDRCLWLQDNLLNNVFIRAQIAAKHVKTFTDETAPEQPAPPPPEAATAPNQKKFVLSPKVTNHVLYRYAFGILFAMVAIVHALAGSISSALVILFVGVILNAYWLTTSGKD